MGEKGTAAVTLVKPQVERDRAPTLGGSVTLRAALPRLTPRSSLTMARTSTDADCDRPLTTSANTHTGSPRRNRLAGFSVRRFRKRTRCGSRARRCTPQQFIQCPVAHTRSRSPARSQTASVAGTCPRHTCHPSPWVTILGGACALRRKVRGCELAPRGNARSGTPRR